MAVAVWGQLWQRKTVLVHCDNQAVVEVINVLMQHIWCILFITAYFEIAIIAVHILGRANGGADAISRNDLPCFFS